MSANAQLEEDIKNLIIETLMLEDMTAEDIDSEDALFGDGVGLDSIDALELGMAISKKYDVKLSKDKEENMKIFANVASLAAFVAEKRAGAQA